ncbi:GNAT family N-acetyltransferase [Mariprofundus erugo]|uniref:GNAT family N-acetyltransferase n=2 Tax=Mariprofundus erugo TaxID=2528639 RepID=A0A5R9GQX6_9PROT|nr:GNAT family N-acetyltransferase [Mariprofundus erugo]
MYLGTTKLTPYLGPWLKPHKTKYANQIGTEKKVMQGLIDELPSFSCYEQSWTPLLTNWMPFYWRDYKQMTKYTYTLPELKDKEALWAGFLEKVRTDIRKAEKAKIVVRDDLSIEDFLGLANMTAQRQGMDNIYPDQLARRIDQVCEANDCRKIFVAQGEDGRLHAGVYIVWDDNCAYYLMGGGDPSLRNSGATSLCMWHAIQYAAVVTNEFNFLGSMIEPIERFFRGFGAKQAPYFCVSKVNSFKFKVIRSIMNRYMKS